MTNLDDAITGLGAPEAEATYEPTFTENESELDLKINKTFAGSVVRKDLVKAVRGNAVVPGYVLEYLLGQYAASDHEDTIQDGIDMVRKILAEHYAESSERRWRAKFERDVAVLEEAIGPVRCTVRHRRDRKSVV